MTKMKTIKISDSNNINEENSANNDEKSLFCAFNKLI